MSMKFHSNTTCDVYRGGSAPPATPDVEGATCFLRPAFPHPGFSGTEGVTNYLFSHMMEVPLHTDIRDSGTGFGPAGDSVYVPDKDGTKFDVVAVIRTSYGTDNDLRRVFLLRSTTSYPTNYI